MDWIKNNPTTSLGIFAGILFIPFLGSVHLFDWDEINFAEVSREMLVLGDYTRAFINYLPFWEKPPFFFWLQVGAMKIFGVGEFAARLPNAITGIVTIMLVFDLGKRLKGELFGFIWALAFLGSVLPNFYFQSGIIDPVFNLMIFLSLYFLIRFSWAKGTVVSFPSKSNLWLVLFLSGAFGGLAVLTKGPAALAILFLTFFVYWVFRRFKWFINPVEFLFYLLSALVVTFIWYGPETIQNGPWFITEFIEYNIRLFSTEDSGHGGFPGYHFVIVFLGCFPASVFTLYAFRMKDEEARVNDFKLWMTILMFVVLILFSIVQSKIVHYSSMTYFPLTFLAAFTIHRWLAEERQLPGALGKTLIGIGVLLGVIIGAIPFLAMNLDAIIPMVDDPFAQGNMEADPGWTGFETLGGLGIILSTFFFLRYWRSGDRMKSVFVLFLGMAISIKLIVSLSVKKVEGHSQAAAIEFFETLKGKDVYIQPVGYKTYAHYFYAEIQPYQKPLIEHPWEWEDYLLENQISKPIYFVSKRGSDWKLAENEDCEFLYEKNGFVFYKKKEKP